MKRFYYLRIMISIIICMMCGIVAGFFLRKWKFLWMDRAMIVIIWLLLFELGVEVGGDRQVLQALPTLGLTALEIAVVALLGSCLAAMGLNSWVQRTRNTVETSPITPNVAQTYQEASVPKKEHPLKGSLIILGFFIAGCSLGYFRPMDNRELLKDISFYTLAVLIVMVGFSIGHNKEVLNNLKSQDKRLLLLPLCTILGTLAATSLLSLLISLPINEILAVASGQAYYSLSSILITQSKGIELGTVALIANIIRELLALLCAPLLYRLFGRLAPIAAGGATTADTTLPIIRQVCGNELAILSIYHGFIVDFSVPFVVTFFLVW